MKMIKSTRFIIGAVILGLLAVVVLVTFVILSGSQPTSQPIPALPGWKLAWNDEFNGTTGTPPNPAYWSAEIGDGSAKGIPGWGNNELEYYTDSKDNAALDGSGNLVISANKVNSPGNFKCFYGDCQYTSARLITANKVTLTYGRIEARIKVPGGTGLWPAFWALGTNLDKVGWPQSGEIDIMEFVGRQPRRIFGTIHGPGYSGNKGRSKTIDLAQDVANDYHIFAIEWQPDKISWYVDSVVYHQVSAADIAPKEWVFNQPFYLILNLAVGGNLGGEININTTFPQPMKVDYIRQYEGIK